MAFDPITFEGNDLTAIADGGFQSALMSDGVVWGCAISVTNSSITIQKGEIILCGRLVHFKSVTTIQLTPTVTSGFGRLVLTAQPNAVSPVILTAEFVQSSFEALTQEDINDTGNTYQIEVARFSVSSSQIGSLISQISRSAISNNVLDNIKLAMYPVGSIYMSANSTNPSQLFGGTWVAWGQGRVPVGVGSNGTTTYGNNQAGGAETVALTTNQMPSHTHTQNSHNHTQNAHNHAFTGSSVATSAAGSHNHTPNGSNVSFLTTGVEPPYAQISATGNTYVIKQKTSTDGAHTHNVTAQGTIGNKTATNKAATAINNNTGGGQAHNNMQPYITCYMWKRTA